ncbi:M10 family metallopeptidase C-terminal domain-containing protein [Mesorhizobium sp. SP-1A]|uniref:M10 family metallopeptidase C-terminal domain-containing protein n=1 Tax=Mesorhizobium sp. SP-1A TaxID=3077840 RepID=UPI0028F72EBF|nr:hypothetical protein [Mesorhizobium sp. SP-1A]
MNKIVENNNVGQSIFVTSLAGDRKFQGTFTWSFAFDYIINEVVSYQGLDGESTLVETNNLQAIIGATGLTGTFMDISQKPLFTDAVVTAFKTLSSYISVDIRQTTTEVENPFLYIFGASDLQDPTTMATGIATGLDDNNSAAFIMFDIERNTEPEHLALQQGYNPDHARVSDGFGSRDDVALHEILHALGLMHPHDIVVGTTLLPQEYDFKRNTIMSYNRHAIDGNDQIINEYGHVMTPMAFDIAALGHMYGLNTTRATGDTMYRIINAGEQLVDDHVNGNVAIGRAFYCISDFGGTDTISAEGANQRALINLNEATLSTSPAYWQETLRDQILSSNAWSGLPEAVKQEFTNLKLAAGGGLSTLFDANGMRIGGFTIAQHSRIEVARGSENDDVIIGNQVRGNTLYGNGGNDLIVGGDESDKIYGGDGDDEIFSGYGNDLIFGDGGNDIIHLGGGFSIAYGGDGNDTFHVFNMYNSSYRIVGGKGFDTMMFKASEFNYLRLVDLADGRLWHWGMQFSEIDNFALDSGKSIMATQIMDILYRQAAIPDFISGQTTFNQEWKSVSVGFGYSDTSSKIVFRATLPDNIDGHRINVTGTAFSSSDFSVRVVGRDVIVEYIGDAKNIGHIEKSIGISTETDVYRDGQWEVDKHSYSLNAATNVKLASVRDNATISGPDEINPFYAISGQYFQFSIEGSRPEHHFSFEVIGEHADKFAFGHGSFYTSLYQLNDDVFANGEGYSITIRATDGTIELFKDVKVMLDRNFEFEPEVKFDDAGFQSPGIMDAAIGSVAGRDYLGNNFYTDWGDPRIKLTAEIIDAQNPDAAVYIKDGLLYLGWSPSVQEDGSTVKVKLTATDKTMLNSSIYVEFTISMPEPYIPTEIIGPDVLDAGFTDEIEGIELLFGDNNPGQNPVVWSILNDESGLFEISTSGILRTVSQLDFSAKSHFTVTVQGFDGVTTLLKTITIEPLHFINMIEGTPGDDILYGTWRSDDIYGGDGDDIIYASGGYDIVYGGAGNDTLIATDFYVDFYGEDGDDILIGSHRGDYLYGGDGNDIIYGGGHKDRIWGGAGADVFVYKDVTDSDYYNLDLSDRIFDLEDDDAFDFTELGDVSFDWDNGPAGSIYVEVNWQPNKQYGYLSIDVDRDGEFDMAIDFDAGAAGLTQINFVNGPTYYLNSASSFGLASTSSYRLVDDDLFASPIIDNAPDVYHQYQWAA